MKQKVKLFLASLALGMSATTTMHAQYLELPVGDIFDTNMMSMALNTAREISIRRAQEYNYNYDMALKASANQQWTQAIGYCNRAMRYNNAEGDLYFIRGYAFEQMGDYVAAKNDYWKGKDLGSSSAASMLSSFNERIRERNRNNSSR